MTLDEALSLVDHHFGCSDGPAGPLDANGKPYVILTSGGLTNEGDGLPAIYRTPDLAAQAWHRSFCLYAAEQAGLLKLEYGAAAVMIAHDEFGAGKVSWRIRPEMNEHIVHVPDIASDDLKLVPQVWYAVYSRFTLTKAG